jgi:apolipoprotein N-acyltransferase
MIDYFSFKAVTRGSLNRSNSTFFMKNNLSSSPSTTKIKSIIKDTCFYKILGIILSAVAGMGLTFSFAPYRYYLFGYISLISLIFLIYLNNQKNYFQLPLKYLGFFWGLGFFATSVSWVFVSIHKYGGTSVFGACLLTGLFVGFLSLFPAINLLILKKLGLDNPRDWRFGLAFPSSWVLMEIFRGWFLTGFPWGLLGYTQLNTSLKYYASVVGVYGVSFLTAIIATLIAQLAIHNYNAIKYHKHENSHKQEYIKNFKYKLIAINSLGLGLVILIFMGGGYIQKRYISINSDNFAVNKQYNSISSDSNTHASNQKGQTHRIAVIQPNIDPFEKFLFRDVGSLIDYIKQHYWQPTIGLKNLDKIDLVVWPENSLPLEEQYPEAKVFLDEVDTVAKQKDFGLLLGLPVVQNDSYYNSVLGLGNARGVYHKINLVPFGDYVPLEKWLRGAMEFFDLPLSIFKAGEAKQRSIQLKKQKLLATICYDIAFAEHLRGRISRENPGVIVNISEDGWFGDSIGPHQHLDLARMRAIENGKFVLRSTTSGISAIIDPNGNVVNQTPMFTKSILLGEYQDCYQQTIWNKIGNKVIIVWLMVCLAVARFSRRLSYD